MEKIYEVYLQEHFQGEELVSFIKRKYEVPSALDYLCVQFGYKDRQEAYDKNIIYFNPPLMNLED